MSKRSNFARRPMDAYDTPFAAVPPLLPFIAGAKTFAEPCAGNGHLVRHLEQLGLRCAYAGDLQDGQDALLLGATDLAKADVIITNPPWTRELLHPLLSRLMRLAPTWLLFDSDWAHTRQAAPYLPNCSHIVAIGRVKWIPDSRFTGKDNAAWYRFYRRHDAGPRFFGRVGVAA